MIVANPILLTWETASKLDKERVITIINDVAESLVRDDWRQSKNSPDHFSKGSVIIEIERLNQRYDNGLGYDIYVRHGSGNESRLIGCVYGGDQSHGLYGSAEVIDRLKKLVSSA